MTKINLSNGICKLFSQILKYFIKTGSLAVGHVMKQDVQ